MVNQNVAKNIERETMEIREIIDLFKDSKYKEAEKELKKKLNEENEEKEYSKIYYMLGIIELEKNKENSKEIAKNYIEESLNYKPVFKLSYYEYDKLEKRDNNIAVGFLRRGLEEFPNDIELYNRLFRRENDKEKYNIINEVIEKEIVDIDLYNLFIEYAFERNLFDLAGKIIDKLKKIVKHGFMNNEYLLLEIPCDILKDKDNIDNYDITVYDIAKDFIDEIIEELHDREMFDYVYRLIKDIKLYILEEMKNKFEIAYSHKDKYIAKKLYENLLNKNPDNSAYNNNIGVIYKEEGNLFKAKEFFEKACMIDPEDKISSNNLQDVNKNIEELYDAYEKVQNENVWILSKLMLLYEEVVDGIVTCSYKEQSKVLQVSAEKAQELFENFVKNGYIVKVKTNDEWGRNQYRINSLIRDYLNERKEYLEENKEYEDIASNINIESLREIGYTKELIEKIEGINDKDFADILLRDFKECAIAVTGKQNKTAIILSGSMAETLLNYKVQEKGIKRYKLLIDGEEKNIRVKDMGLAELLEVAKKENIIHQTDYHLTQVVRNYRNLIHPSVELRKSMHISEQEATLKSLF